MAAVINNTSKYWTNGIVPYRFNDTAYPASSKERCIVTKAMDEIQFSTNVRFIPHTSQNDYIYFNTAAGSCTSAVGRQGGMQEIGCDIASGLFGQGSVIHELLHALGYIHEHQRTDRDEFVSVNQENVKRFQDFYLFLEPSLNVTPYDYGSIMHYPARIVSKNLVNDSSIDTLKALKPIPAEVILGQRGKLSTKDIEGINAIYYIPNATPVLTDCSVITTEEIVKNYWTLLFIPLLIVILYFTIRPRK